MYYIQAHRKDGSRVLGNCDGQMVLRANRPERCEGWKRLVRGEPAALDGKVAYWTLVTEGGSELARAINKRNPPA